MKYDVYRDTVRVSSIEEIESLLKKTTSMSYYDRESFLRGTTIRFSCKRCGKDTSKKLRAFVQDPTILYCHLHTRHYNWIKDHEVSWEDFDKKDFDRDMESRRRESIIKKHGSWEEAERVRKERLAEFEVREYGSHEAFRKKRDVALRKTALDREKDPKKRAEKEKILKRIDAFKEDYDETLVGKKIECVSCKTEFESRGRHVCNSCLLLRTHLENYGTVENYAKTMQSNLKKSMLEKYGYDNSMAVPEIRDKAQKTKISRYGNTNNSKKTQATKLERYGNGGYNNVEKQRKTLLEKYGYDHAWKVPEIRRKMEDTCVRRYGEDWKKVVFSRVQRTKLERYGDKNYTNSRKAVKTILVRYAGLTEEKARSIVDSLEKPDPRLIAVKYVHVYENVVFESSWELVYYRYLQLRDISFTYKPDPIPYIGDDDLEHLYYPDFFTDRFVEIKGDHLLRDGILYDKRHGFNYAKTKCLEDNDVEILSTKEMNEVFLFLKKNLPDFKTKDFKLLNLVKTL